MKRIRRTSLFAIVSLVAIAGTAIVAAPLPPLGTLQPGAFRDIRQKLPVNIVFVGYEQGPGAQQISVPQLLADLPETYRARHRFPSFYGIRQFNGVSFEYDYNIVFADQAFEDAFFTWAAANGTTGPRTVYQNLYNSQPSPPRSQTIPATILRIDAPAAEAWLAENAPAYTGVDTTRYTVFFINWWGRSDFQYHVYRKTDEPDHDTGFPFGQLSSRAIIAYGGTPAAEPAVHRVWFHDLSAGPEFNTDNWNLTVGDFNGNGQIEDRMPPIWEYGNPSSLTFRPFNTLSADLGKVTRFAALNLLFTTSPLYKPAISPPNLPSDIRLDVNLYQGEPGFDARTILDEDHLASQIGALQPLNAFSATVTDWPLAGRAGDVYDCFVRDLFVAPESCFGKRLFGIGFGDLFLYHSDHLTQYIEGGTDYSVPIFTYNTTTDRGADGLLGFADDNWRDGTQSFVFSFNNTEIRSFGFGLTGTMIHEVGHHVGMSHPHDGYDYELNLDYGPSDALYFAWIGDESHSIMGYLFFGSGFSQFDRDNMNRYLTAAYINQANAVLAMIAASPRAGQVATLVLQADAAAAAALNAYDDMNYSGAAGDAKSAYERVLAAAATIDVPVEPQSWQADYKAKGTSPKFVDIVPYDRLTAR
jgi:hypothetical protein